MAKEETAISPTRAENYPEWYQQVIRAADLAENSPVRGCMVIKPWGYGIWENLQRELDQRIKATGHENAYFPLFIPLSFLEKEAEHVEGFAKECAVVTHHRLEEKDGKLIPTGELEEPLIVRPTSETIIGESFKRWIQSYRDLPVLINQWCNVVRWEMRTRLFLRTSEFLWQEGHTAHSNEREACEEQTRMLEVYRDCVENVLAIPVICGEKPAHERFPGAVSTYSIEAMMQDRKALQAGTSHYLGQNFARASGIEFAAENGDLELAYTTSWGVSTRLVGGMIMTHGDDNGLRVPPRVAPKHVVILPVLPSDDDKEKVFSYAEKVKSSLAGLYFDHTPIVSFIDTRDLRGGEKNWQWIKKGVPVRIEVGPRDIEKDAVVLFRRDKKHRDKIFLQLSELPQKLPLILKEIQENYLAEAKAFCLENTRSDISDLKSFKTFFTPKNENELHGGFVRAKWCEDPESLDLIADLKVTVRCIPFDQDGRQGKCILTGKPAVKDVIFAKTY